MISRKISPKTKLQPCWAKHITNRKTRLRNNVWNIIMAWALCITKHTLILKTRRISWQMPNVNLVSHTQLDSILLQKLLNLCQLIKIQISDRKIRSKCLSECQTVEEQLEGKLEESFSNILPYISIARQSSQSVTRHHQSQHHLIVSQLIRTALKLLQFPVKSASLSRKPYKQGSLTFLRSSWKYNWMSKQVNSQRVWIRAKITNTKELIGKQWETTKIRYT